MRLNNKSCNVVTTDGTNQWHNISEIYNVQRYQSTNFLNASACYQYVTDGRNDGRTQNRLVLGLALSLSRRETLGTFRVRRSQGEMYIGHGRPSVCPFLAAVPHYCTEPDVTWGEW